MPRMCRLAHPCPVGVRKAARMSPTRRGTHPWHQASSAMTILFSQGDSYRYTRHNHRSALMTMSLDTLAFCLIFSPAGPT